MEDDDDFGPVALDTQRKKRAKRAPFEKVRVLALIPWFWHGFAAKSREETTLIGCDCNAMH